MTLGFPSVFPQLPSAHTHITLGGGVCVLMYRDVCHQSIDDPPCENIKAGNQTIPNCLTHTGLRVAHPLSL